MQFLLISLKSKTRYHTKKDIYEHTVGPCRRIRGHHEPHECGEQQAHELKEGGKDGRGEKVGMMDYDANQKSQGWAECNQ
jgi:hypothetical protein